MAEYAADDLPEEITVKGRGGTDYRPGFAWLDEQGIEPGVCLYFTDMECSDFPQAEAPFPTIWVDYGDPDSPWRHPVPWFCAHQHRRLTSGPAAARLALLRPLHRHLSCTCYQSPGSVRPAAETLSSSCP